MHGRPSEEVGQRGPRGHAPGVRGRRAIWQPGRRPPSDPPQRQTWCEPRGLGQGAEAGAGLRQGASEVPGSGIRSSRGRHDLFGSRKNHSFGGCAVCSRYRRVGQDRARNPLSGPRGPATLPIGSGLRYLPLLTGPVLFICPRRSTGTLYLAMVAGGFRSLLALSSRKNVFRTTITPDRYRIVAGTLRLLCPVIWRRKEVKVR